MIPDNQVITVTKATYCGGYKLALEFSDGKPQIIDFENFITRSLNPHINKYRELDLFKAFSITEGDLQWNDYDLCFPIEDLYENKNIAPSGQSSAA